MRKYVNFVVTLNNIKVHGRIRIGYQIVVSLTNQLSNEKPLVVYVCLEPGYIGDFTSQLHGDDNKPL